MKVNDPNLSSLASTGAAGLQGPAKTSSGTGTSAAGTAEGATSDGVHLSELVRSLRSLASESPENQARVEQIAKSVANGSYKVDAQGTASKIIDDALQQP